MRTKSLIPFLFSVSIFLFATKGFATPPRNTNSHWVSNQDIITASYGQFAGDFKNLNAQLKSWGATKTFAPNFTSAGLNFSGTFNVSRGGVYDGAYSFDYIIPQDVYIGDTSHFHFHGWQLMTSLYGKDLIPGKVVALVLAPGIAWGNVKIKSNISGSESRYADPFVAPFARAELRFVIWRIALGVRASYRFDITKGEWRIKAGDNIPYAGSKLSGFGLQFFVGYGKAF